MHLSLDLITNVVRLSVYVHVSGHVLHLINHNKVKLKRNHN